MAPFEELNTNLEQFVANLRKDISGFEAEMKDRIRAAQDSVLFDELLKLNKRLDAIERRLPSEDDEDDGQV